MNDRELCCFTISCKMSANIDTVVYQLIKLLKPKNLSFAIYISFYVTLQSVWSTMKLCLVSYQFFFFLFRRMFGDICHLSAVKWKIRYVAIICSMKFNKSLCTYICSNTVQWTILRNKSWSLAFVNYTITNKPKRSNYFKVDSVFLHVSVCTLH